MEFHQEALSSVRLKKEGKALCGNIGTQDGTAPLASDTGGINAHSSERFPYTSDAPYRGSRRYRLHRLRQRISRFALPADRCRRLALPFPDDKKAAQTRAAVTATAARRRECGTGWTPDAADGSCEKLLETTGTVRSNGPSGSKPSDSPRCTYHSTFLRWHDPDQVQRDQSVRRFISALAGAPSGFLVRLYPQAVKLSTPAAIPVRRKEPLKLRYDSRYSFTTNRLRAAKRASDRRRAAM